MNFTLPKVQVVIGLLALMVAAVLATNISARQFKCGPLAGAGVGGNADVAVRVNAAQCAGEAVHHIAAMTEMPGFKAGGSSACPSDPYRA